MRTSKMRDVTVLSSGPGVTHIRGSADVQHRSRASRQSLSGHRSERGQSGHRHRFALMCERLQGQAAHVDAVSTVKLRGEACQGSPCGAHGLRDAVRRRVQVSFGTVCKRISSTRPRQSMEGPEAALSLGQQAPCAQTRGSVCLGSMRGTAAARTTRPASQRHARRRTRRNAVHTMRSTSYRQRRSGVDKRPRPRDHTSLTIAPCRADGGGRSILTQSSESHVDGSSQKIGWRSPWSQLRRLRNQTSRYARASRTGTLQSQRAPAMRTYSRRGPTVAASACCESAPYVAIATAMASSKLFEAAVKL